MVITDGTANFMEGTSDADSSDVNASEMLLNLVTLTAFDDVARKKAAPQETGSNPGDDAGLISQTQTPPDEGLFSQVRKPLRQPQYQSAEKNNGPYIDLTPIEDTQNSMTEPVEEPQPSRYEILQKAYEHDKSIGEGVDMVWFYFL